MSFINQINHEEIIKQSHKLDFEILDIKYDSRGVKPGDAFIAIPGVNKDGREYIQEAIDKGAKLIVSEGYDDQILVPQVQVKNARKVLSEISSLFFGNPSRDIYLSGVTGTNGKTTISHMLHSIWKASQVKSGLISTIDIQYNDHQYKNTHTTPESYQVQKILKHMKEEFVDHVVMEVSSHGLDQCRVEHLEFDSCIFTNLTQDHLDYHQSMESYFESKLRLFLHLLQKSSKQNKVAIINLDDPWGEKIFKKLTDTSFSVHTYGRNEKCHLKVMDSEVSLSGIEAKLKLDDDFIDLKTHLVGEYNLANIQASILAALHGGVDLEKVLNCIKNYPGVSGRLERIDREDGLKVFVDYAHTPDALKNVLKTLRPLVSGKMITLFGCGGDRDQQKRPLMGMEAAQYSDICLITSDNPRSENPQIIINQIVQGIESQGMSKFKDGKGYIDILDRREAIETAINLANEKDVILIAGKGHEDYQIIGHEKLYFSDQENVKKIFNLI